MKPIAGRCHLSLCLIHIQFCLVFRDFNLKLVQLLDRNEVQMLGFHIFSLVIDQLL